ncbi:MAG: cytochrome c [Candidatus Rokubacteria bacterium]|nr:cytochrome c [Candidatus Rokubacteria bacterium]
MRAASLRRAVLAALLAGTVAGGPARSAAEGSGQEVFARTCAFCHFTDTTDRKVGPGLEGLFRRERLPVSGDPVSEERVRRQIRRGSGVMPPHPHLSDTDVAALVHYLRTL